MKNFIIFSLILLIQGNVTGQSASLEIGDKVPNLKINHLINYHKSSAEISDFKGQLLILDFWATWCAPCVSSFPKLDSLQAEFRDKIQIISVTDEPEEKVRLLFEKQKTLKSISPVSAVGDKILGRAFRHSELPHYVWISQDGIVVAITNGNDLNQRNISAFLNGENVKLAEKKDPSYFVNSELPIFLDSPQLPIEKDKVILSHKDSSYESILIKGWYPGIGGSTWDNARVSCLGCTIVSLYATACSKRRPDLINPGRVLLEVKDSSKLIFPFSMHDDRSKMRDWGVENMYNYEIMLSGNGDENSEEVLLRMQDELNAYFGKELGIYGSLEKRKLKCLALIRTDSVDRLRSTGSKADVKKKCFLL